MPALEAQLLRPALNLATAVPPGLEEQQTVMFVFHPTSKVAHSISTVKRTSSVAILRALIKQSFKLNKSAHKITSAVIRDAVPQENKNSGNQMKQPESLRISQLNTIVLIWLRKEFNIGQDTEVMELLTVDSEVMFK